MTILFNPIPNQALIDCLSKTLFFTQKHIDWVILTKNNKNNILGLNYVLKYYFIKNIGLFNNPYSSEITSLEAQNHIESIDLSEAPYLILHDASFLRIFGAFSSDSLIQPQLPGLIEIISGKRRFLIFLDIKADFLYLSSNITTDIASGYITTHLFLPVCGLRVDILNTIFTLADHPWILINGGISRGPKKCIFEGLENLRALTTFYHQIDDKRDEYFDIDESN